MLKFYLAKVRIRIRFDAMQNVVNQREMLFQGGDVWNTRLLHLLLPKGGREPHFLRFWGK